jgi:membrane fusion protein, copper/silver efflux system
MNTTRKPVKKKLLAIGAAILAAAIVVLAAIGALTWRIPFMGSHEHGKTAEARPVPSDEENIAYWTCVMHPSVRQPGPGNCPVCSMDLVPQRKGAGLTLTRRQKDLIPVRTEPVGFHSLHKEIRTVGVLEYNERKLAYVSTRVSGWIEETYVDFTGTKVRQNDHLVRIYSRELLPAQQEYLGNLHYLKGLEGADEAAREKAREDVSAAEDKLLLLGVTREQIERLKELGTVETEIVLYASIGGTVIEMNAYKGRHVKEGENLYKIADLSSLWAIADVYEYELPWLRWGQDVEITCDACPGKTFSGRIWFIYPYLRTETRTAKVLVEVPNPDEGLKPGMSVTVRLKVFLRDIYEPPPAPPYACPMHPWVASDQPGKCSLCGMDLEKTSLEPAAEQPATQTYWTCPMHPEVHEKEPGNCPICGMKLVERKEGQPATKTVLTCGMEGHPEFEPGTQPEDGRCPVCEMMLVEKQINVPGTEEGRPLFKYVCPDHPDQISTEPGRCPTDGKELVMTDEVLSVPKTAVIDTGERKVVYVDKGEAGYVPTEVVLGPEGWAAHEGARTRFFPVIKGLQPGEMVVTHGNFLIDSQSQITGAAAGAFGGAIGKEESGAMPPGHRH